MVSSRKCMARASCTMALALVPSSAKRQKAVRMARRRSVSASSFRIRRAVHIGSGSIPSRRNPLRLADGQLRHHLDELAPRLVRVLKGVAEHLDVIAILVGGDGEAVRRLVGTRRRRAPPRAVDQLEAEELRSLAGLKTLRGRSRHAAGVGFLLVERARHQRRDHPAQLVARLPVRLDDAQPGVVDALLRRVLAQTLQHVARHFAAQLDGMSFPLERQRALAARRGQGSLMGDARSVKGDVDDEDPRLADACRVRPDQGRALVPPSLFGWKCHARCILRHTRSGRVLAPAGIMSPARKTALIAEDDAALRRMMVTLLRPLDIEVDEACDGLEAVQRLREHPYDIVIVDLMMPRVDGYSVIRYLEEKQPDARAIVTSAMQGEELAGVARSNVVHGVLSKPFDIDEFSSSVREVIAA